MPLEDLLIDTPGGYRTSLSAHPVGGAAGSSGGSSRRHWPPYRAYSLNQRECYGACDPPDRRPPTVDGHPPYHRDRAHGAGGFSASVPPPPPHSRAEYGVESPGVVQAPDRRVSGGICSRRPLRPRRESDISPLPLLPPPLPTRSTEGERHREHHHHRARDERNRSRSPRFHSPFRGSRSAPLPLRHRLEDRRKESKSLPSSKTKWHRLEDGRKGSSSSRHCYDDGGRSGSRDRYGDSRHTQELAYPSSCDQGHHYLGDSKRKISLRDHSESVQHRLPPRGKPPLAMPIEMSPWDDGYKSPTSPTYRCEDELDIERGSHNDDKNETPGWLDSASVSYDGSGIVGRDRNFKNEDPVLKTKEDSAYNELVDDFMDAVTKSWHDTNPKEAHQKQADRFAELALKRYNKNKNNMVKYALVEAIVGASIFEGWKLYGHVNFYAKAKNGPKKNDGKVLVFAELQQIGRRPNAMVLTCFQLLDENNHLCGCHDLAPSCRMIQGQDMDHCYACSDRIKHPDGSLYKAGHFVDMLCYHF